MFNGLSMTFNPVLAALMSARIVPSFDPLTLFAAGEPGVWYDPSDKTTLFQDAAGTTPVTAVEQPVGLMLDKSKGLVLGPELVANGDFSNGSTGWTLGNGWSVSAGQATFTSPGYAAIIAQNNILVAGKFYLLKFSVSGPSISVRPYFGTYAGAPFYTVAGNYSIYFFAGADSTFGFQAQVGAALNLDNISVRELPGNHAYQTTATSRPVLSARYNLWTNTETLATQSRTVRAAKHIISFSGTGTVTLSGAFSGSLVGTGVNDRVYLEFTTTAGTLTATVSGSVTKAQLEEV